MQICAGNFPVTDNSKDKLERDTGPDSPRI